MMKVEHFVSLLLCFLYCPGLIGAGEDFYKLLGVDRGASVKEIRKAFKRIAITKHPDKNPDDPDAHEHFTKINRAYEVLKDEDLRKKYDQHGEDGLSDNFQRGRRYESWQWYQQNFGIYDDDPEIITLTRTEFEQSVLNTEEPWFINFFSPHCSHCHELAPAWRELARELEGVIRIGAVNCGDEWQLCRMQNIRSYPSLVFYPQQERYYGERIPEVMIEEALRNVKASYYQLWTGNFKETILDSNDGLPWLITFCGDGGDCLETKTCIKLAATLADLVNVGYIDCHTDSSVCTDLKQEYGTFYFDSDSRKKGFKNGLEITSLNAQEISRIVMEQLPDVEILRENEIQALIEDEREETWLLHFVNSLDNHDLELRKLPSLLNEYKVGRVDCSQMRLVCQQLHIFKYPSFAILKERGGMEIYYGGRTNAHDIAAFVQDSANVPLENLSPNDFPDRVVLSSDPWLVDFFAPWCPPCMRLLPEFKKAAKSYGSKVNFGTVDCTIHSSLCNNYNVQSYPTTIFYNNTVPHQYHGHHSAHHIIEFIQDTMNPPVMSLDHDSFETNVFKKKKDEVWLVDFFAPWCGPCQQLAPEWRKLAKMFKDKPSVHVAQVDCTTNQRLCQDQAVNSYPSVRLYPPGNTRTNQFVNYNGWHRDASSLRSWVYDYLPSKVITLTSQDFSQKVLESSKPWIIDFYTPWCGHCQVFKPQFERVAEGVEGIAFAGKVDCDREYHICQQASIRAYPTVRFYQGTSRGVRQHASGLDINSQDANQLIHFVKSNSPGFNMKKAKDEL